MKAEVFDVSTIGSFKRRKISTRNSIEVLCKKPFLKVGGGGVAMHQPQLVQGTESIYIQRWCIPVSSPPETQIEFVLPGTWPLERILWFGLVCKLKCCGRATLGNRL